MEFWVQYSKKKQRQLNQTNKNMEDINYKSKIKKLLAEHLGIDITDINDTDSLTADLHMEPTDVSDFIKTLEDEGFDISKIELTEVETFEDLLDSLAGNELIE